MDQLESSAEAVERESAFGKVLMGVAFTILAVALVTVFGRGFFAESYLDKCEDALKATLKAPATYKRVKTDGVGGEDGIYNITYDANNSFNVPLRGHGTCMLSKGQPRWMDFSDLPE